MTTDIRDIPEAHLDRALELADLAFHAKTGDAARKRQREMLLDCERVGAYDGEEIVGFTAAHRLGLSVPGGELPAAELDFVSVAPTHRRRGVLTGMLDELWRRCAAGRRPLACLWASEDAIYGRFGFGPATEAYAVEIDSSRPLDLRITPDRRPLRLLAPEAAVPVIAPLYQASRARRAGLLVRDEAWWRRSVLAQDEDDDDDDGPARIVVLGDKGAPAAGYVIYRVGEKGAVTVQEMEAADAPAAAALWTYLASIDLTRKVRAWVAADDPLLLFAADRDQVRVTGQWPALWLRLVDVAEALTARSWAAPADLVLEVRDATLPANAGRFRLTADPSGATYEPAGAPADLALDVRDLASCYLGGTPLRRLVRAGLVEERTPGAARLLDAALETEHLPFTGEDY
ncbi:GNAT family N-acetyltransferase [Streptomyces albofaciens JCM 4342]|uniref:GNAT family N-acetyltransferase n=1 Tax=Streptomyces albofaciens TaxID=66866 RepID=UPI00123B83A4|nr:GNAT family N-acetyltransferase [Streptomyces albofaciens]KAA6213212.1 GNAT family N-acetyltransferase [Streptomyces albofaciens JCM 4342]